MIKGIKIREKKRSASGRFLIASRIRSKKGDVRMQEMAFVLLAIVLLAAIVFVFSIRLQSSKIMQVSESLNQQRALSLRDKIASLPELKCARMPCIDEDRAEMMQNYKLDDLFYGLSGAKIIKIYPSGGEIVLYKSGRPMNMSYSTFVNLCQQKLLGSTFGYDCGLAMLEVST